MRDMHNLPGVAKPKTNDDMERHLQSLRDGGEGSAASFANPERNVERIGIENSMHVADFGAGSGAYTFAMAQRMGNGGLVYAIDVQRDLLRRIKNEAESRGLKNVRIVWGDVENAGGSKLTDGSIDVVIISNILFQLEDKGGAMREAWRVLRNGGKLAVIEWSESYGGMGPHKNDVVRKDEALEFAQREGFTPIQEFNAGAHHYGLTFRKPLNSGQ